MVFGYVDDEMDGDRGPQTVMWSKEFYETDPARGFVRGYTLQFVRGTGPANEAITSMAAGRLPWGKDHQSRLPLAALSAPVNRRCVRGPARGAQSRHLGPGAEG
jgi:hypothetical protein